jgi:hypothetical protein
LQAPPFNLTAARSGLPEITGVAGEIGGLAQNFSCRCAKSVSRLIRIIENDAIMTFISLFLSRI